MPNGEAEDNKSGRCEDCGGHIVKDRVRAETYCDECGRVYDQNMPADGAGTAIYDGDEKSEKKKQHGPTETYLRHDKGMSTEIDWKNKDAQGHSIPAKNRPSINRIRKQQKRTNMEGESTFIRALENLNNYGTALGLPRDVKEETAYYLRQVRDVGFVRGRDYVRTTAAIYYLVCRMRGVPKSLDTMAKNCGIQRKEVGRIVTDLQKLDGELGKAFRILPPPPEKYLPYLCTELHLSSETQLRTRQLINDGKARGISEGDGRNPVGLAGAALYIGCILANERRTQREIAEKSDVTEVTIRNNYRLYNEELGLGLKDD